MFEFGQQVFYGVHGVCTVTGIEYQKSVDKQITYLVLEPQNQPGSRFLVPTHNISAMAKVQKVLTKEELDRLLHSDDVTVSCWIPDEGKRKQNYRELIGCGDRVKLMAMLHTLYLHMEQQSCTGRKIHLCDENFMRDTEKLLASEIAVVFDMEANAAKQYLRSCLKK